MSLMPIRAPLDVKIISLAINEFITATASACCRSSRGLGTVIAKVLPPAVVKVNRNTLFVVTAMVSPSFAADFPAGYSSTSSKFFL